MDGLKLFYKIKNKKKQKLKKFQKMLSRICSTLHVNPVSITPIKPSIIYD
jgi:hypothetical protein